MKNLLGVNQPPHGKSVLAIQKWVDPLWLINRGGESPHQSATTTTQEILCLGVCHMQSHALNTTPFKSHTELWLWQTSDRDSRIRFCWLNTNYNRTSWVVKLFCCIGTSLFETLQSQACDFAVTDLWLCNHMLSLAVLVQTKFLANLKKGFPHGQFLY